MFEIAGDQMYFEAISRTGQMIDSGILPRPKPSEQARSTEAGGSK
jgi:hypothetical protein